MPFVVIGISLSYLLIKQENKSYPIPSAIFVGSILGTSLYFCTLQLNRIYSENYALTVPIKMTLIEVYRGSQIWHLDTKYTQDIGLNEIYVHQHWQGYSTHAEQGKTYNILVKKGLFNDYFVDVNSFSNINANATLE